MKVNSFAEGGSPLEFDHEENHTINILFSFPALAIISPTECVKTRNTVGMGMHAEMIKDFKIDRSSATMKKTKAEIISIFQVNNNIAIFMEKRKED